MNTGLCREQSPFWIGDVLYDFSTNVRKGSIEYHLYLAMRRSKKNPVRLVIRPEAFSSLGDPMPGKFSGVFITREDYPRVRKVLNIYHDACERVRVEVGIDVDWT